MTKASHEYERSPEPPKGAHALRKAFGRGGRENLWAILDALDARPVLKKSLLIGLPSLVLALGLGDWAYQRWARTNALRIAHQWLAAGRLDRAGDAVQDAIAHEADLPETWQLASELAWRKGNRPASVEYAKMAADVSRHRPDEVIAWAEASVLADDMAQAREALEYLDMETARSAPRALRVAGEIARRGGRFAEARDKFGAALQADTAAGAAPLAADEVPLGIVSLQTGAAADRARGRTLLQEWAADPRWGADALRALLADAVAHNDADSTTLWAEGLRRHPLCTLGDVPKCLQALAGSSPQRYQVALAAMEADAHGNPTQAAQLLGWLVEIGHADEAVRWGATLDKSQARIAPIAPGYAEALRASGRWPELQAWTDGADWGHDVSFLGLAYGLVAARHLGDAARADQLWRSLFADGTLNPAHALFAGDSLYAWGYPKDAASLLWAAAERPDLAFLAMGTLARLYQVQGDAVGQYRAFSRLNEMRPGDRKIANNCAYFAALTDLGGQTHIARIAEDNFNGEPSNAVYRSTYAFVLVWTGQADRALALMEPIARDWRKSPAIAFTYGAVLASVGRKPEAKEVFDSLDPRTLSPQESDWIKAALR
jgi:predicted Zn-dependent protease